MDQGLAAFVAGGFGLIGAAIGGAAAVWGARQQVRAQAVIEHQHWSRQMQREAYEGFVTGAYEVIDSFRRLVAAFGTEGREALSDQLKRQLHDLLTLSAQVGLAGPDWVHELAHEASVKVTEAGERLLEVDTPSELRAASDLNPLMAEAARATDEFANGARLILQHPPS
ncbi:hypothetical protein ACWDX6_17430 [Streptomyces sp. NPDC003027]